ncbi:exodeoxyribonuclease III [Candidatus Campbellbacteria bacterium]|nr:MAG: exodeoxyribonuclease III [Candidatus Campbellbacteria bacterium]
MKLLSWNVNGFRAWAKKENVFEFLEKQKADIICLQETKAQKEQIEDFIKDERLDFFKKYKYHFFNSAEKKGYSGVAFFTKEEPLNIEFGIGHDLDSEGRVITLEFEKFFVTGVYTPNSKPDLSRVDVRHQSWDKDFLKFVKKKEKKKPVIFCGDLNVAHTEIDLKNPQTNKTTETKPGNAGFTDKEREGFENFLKKGFIDTFRFKNPESEKYSWWSYRFNARKNNSGWRIDYFLVSESLKNKIKKAEIYDQVLGSDHCPVFLEINLK